jgi:hypothetical protein
MPQMDAFSAQIVKFVREMPDEALLDLVKQKLGVLGVPAARRDGRGAVPVAPAPLKASPRAPTNPKAKRAGAAEKRRPAEMRRAPPPSAERTEMLDAVERIVKAGSGVSASDVARAAGIPQTRAAAALKLLKTAKRIFQGGDRRFARYASDPKAAEHASSVARKSAKGPALTVRDARERPESAPSPRGDARPRKRAQPAVVAPAG